MYTTFLRKTVKFSLAITGLGLLVFGLPRALTVASTQSRVRPAAEVEPRPVAIVFGAGLRRDRSPTPILQDRIATAAGLYFAGKVEVLLMSGDNRFAAYDEPTAMQQYALSLGVPASAMVRDYAGRRTYDTCYRAREIFGVTEAILVTQAFHLPRALFTCRALGVQAEGVLAEGHYFRKITRAIWNLRELPATVVAWWDVFVTRPVPVLGVPEPIFPLETQ